MSSNMVPGTPAKLNGTTVSIPDITTQAFPPYVHEPTERSAALFLRTLPTELLIKISEYVLSVPPNVRDEVSVKSPILDSVIRYDPPTVSVLDFLLTCRRINEVAKETFYQINHISIFTVMAPGFITNVGLERLRGVRNLTLLGGLPPHIVEVCADAMPRLKTLSLRVGGTFFTRKLEDDPDLLALQRSVECLSSVEDLRIDIWPIAPNYSGWGVFLNTVRKLDIARLIAALPYNVKKREKAVIESSDMG